jgi:hypothetical protein
MNIQLTLYKLLVNVLILAFVTTMFDVVTFPEDAFYLYAIYLIYAIGIMIHDNILTFLTVKKVFLTRLLATAIIISLIFFFFEFTFPGFSIGRYTLDPQKFEFITIESFTLGKYVTIVLLATASGFVSSLLIWLQESGKQG